MGMTLVRDIAFVIHYPFQWFVYKNTYRELEERAEFIIDMGAFFPVDQPPGLLERIVELLEKNKAHYRILKEDDYHDPEYLESFFAPYKTLVSVWERGSMQLPCNDDKRKVNMTYGSGKELTMVRPSRGIHDVILAYGPRDHTLFSYYTRSVTVGNPRFDDWFNGTVDSSDIPRVTQSLVPSKKTVLYLPTHGDLSSIGSLSGSLSTLVSLYNVIVKTHYFTTEEEQEHVSLLQKSGVILVTDETDLLPLLSSADVVLSDNSSAIFDAILADKPTVVTDFLPDEYLDVSHKELRELRRTMQGASTFSQSIEQLIKKEGRVLTLKKAESLAPVIAEAVKDSEHFRAQRAQLREELYSYRDGGCAKRAATEIRRVTDAPKSYERPILYHAIEAYKAHLDVFPREKQKTLERALRDAEKLLGMRSGASSRSYSVVWTCTRHIHGSSCARSLKAVLSLAPVRGIFEVIVVDAACRALVGSFVSKNALVRTVPTVDALCTELAAQAYSTEEKRVIVCTTSEALLPRQWLIELEAAYMDEEVVAVGSVALQKAENVYEQYVHYALSKRLGLYFFESFMPRVYKVSNRAFDQNPCGDVRAFSCDARMWTPRIQHCSRMEDIVPVLKARAVQRGDICLLPSEVRATAPMYKSLVEIIRAQFVEGARHYFLRKDILKTGSSYTPYTEIQYTDVLHLICRGMRYVRLASVVGVARTSWLLGRCTARTARLFRRRTLRHANVDLQEQTHQST
jgi:hypothetical protein